jgi:exocyst complex component 1
MSPPANRAAVMSRAEKFEDEKRRIMETCFGKQDESGGCM